MKKWQNVEEILNRFILKLLSLVGLVLKKSTPSRVQKKLQQGQRKLVHKKEKLHVGLGKSKKKSFQLLTQLKYWPNKIIFKVQEFLGLVITKVQSFKPRKIHPFEPFMLLAAFLAPLLYKIKNWWGGLKPETIALTVVGTAAFGLTTLGLITSTQKITEKESPAREPAAKVEKATKISTRPHYYKDNEKQFTVLNVQMPIYVGGVNDIKSLRVDLTITPSNRYIREYFFDNEYLVQDKLNSSIRPIVPEFPLEEEGKRILKEKVRQEVNELLKELEIKGEIKEVHIKSMLAG